MWLNALAAVGYARVLRAHLWIGLFSITACQSAELGTTEQAIIGGSPSANDSAVVGIAPRQLDCGQDITSISCTGTLIAPRVVVTAAHCLGYDPANGFSVLFGASATAGGTLIPVVGGRAHPDFDTESHANDIAVLILESDAPAGVTPIPMHTTALPDLTGTTVRMIGYGITSISGTDTGERMTGEAMVTEVSTDDIRMEPAPAMSCHGDSGGPVLADTGAGEELVGVTSYGDAACAQFGVAKRVDRQLAFIQTILDEAAAWTERRPFDPSEDLCARTCASDADCPADTVCFSIEDQPTYCVYRGLPAGSFGATCTASNGDALCTRMPDGTCRFYAACSSEPPDDGCCNASSSSGGWLSSVVLALAIAFVRRRGRN